MQSLGLTEVAYQNAVAYAKDRRQMRSLTGPKQPDQPADTIIVHPDVRRMLLTARAYAEGARALCVHTALRIDQELHHPDEDVRKEAADEVALLTPIVKAFITDNGWKATSECLQVFGGHGYIAEWGMEQHVRDARVAMIYEGTNEIQAIDLLVRKVLADGGQSLGALLDGIEADLPAQAPSRTAALARIGTLRAVTQQIVNAAAQDAQLPYRVADDYLRACALVLLEWAWLRIDAALDAQPQHSIPRWRAPAQALRQWVLPEFQMRTYIIVQQCTAAGR